MAAASRLKRVNVHVYEQRYGTGYKRISCFDAPRATRTIHVLYRGGEVHCLRTLHGVCVRTRAPPVWGVTFDVRAPPWKQVYITTPSSLVGSSEGTEIKGATCDALGLRFTSMRPRRKRPTTWYLALRLFTRNARSRGYSAFWLICATALSSPALCARLRVAEATGVIAAGTARIPVALSTRMCLHPPSQVGGKHGGCE